MNRRARLLALTLLLDSLAAAVPCAAMQAPGPPAQAEASAGLAALADEGRWDEVHERAAERLALDAADRLAQYWEARAEIERAQPLLGGRTYFSQDLGRAMLTRAAERLQRLERHPDDESHDARDWAAYARFLARDNESLRGELEAAYASEAHGYSAYLLALLAREHGEPEVLTWLERACAAEPTRTDFLLEWAGALAAAGQPEAAMQAWRRARDAGAPLPALLDTLAGMLPGPDLASARLAALESLLTRDAATRDGTLAWHRAWTLQQLGRTAEAADILAAASENRTPALERAHAQLLSSLGRTAEAAGHLRSAAAAGDAAALSDLVSLADGRAGARAWDEALALYEAALAIEPRDERAAVNRALTLGQAGRSLQPWEELIARLPRRADILNDAAIHYAGWGRTAEAMSLLERAIELPGAADARQNLADLLLARAEADHARALELLDSVLAEDPSRDWALYLRQSARRGAAR